MITLRQHEPRDYAVLPDMDLTEVGALSDADRLCLDEFGACLVRAGAHERFGATLLHSHFTPDTGEIFIEEADLAAKLLRLRPTREASVDLAAVNVCFEESPMDEDEIRLVGLEFASPAILGGVAPINAADGEVLAGLRNILVRHRKAGRFGLRLFHDPLQAGDAILVETYNPAKRLLTCTLAPPDDAAVARAVATVFRWTRAVRDDNDLAISQYCEQICNKIQVCGDGGGNSHIIVQTHSGTSIHSHDPGPA